MSQPERVSSQEYQVVLQWQTWSVTQCLLVIKKQSIDAVLLDAGVRCLSSLYRLKSLSMKKAYQSNDFRIR